MDLAIVIVSYNVRELLRGCLASVGESLAASPQMRAEVWVVDNASTDDSAALVRTEYPGVHLVASAENLGFAGGNNLALRLLGLPIADNSQLQAPRSDDFSRSGALRSDDFSRSGALRSDDFGRSSALRSDDFSRSGALRSDDFSRSDTLRSDDFSRSGAQKRLKSPLRGEPSRAMPDATPRYVLLLNPDTVVQGDALAQMAAFLDKTPQAGGCGAQLAYPDGRFQHSAFRFPTLAQIAFDFFPPPGRLNQPLLDSRLNGRYSRQSYQQGDPFPVDFVLGAALMVRTTAICQVGLLDESYFMYCEEMDWQRRLAAAGWLMFCVPEAQVIHYGGASSSQFRSAMLTALWRSRFQYFQRYHSPVFNQLASQLVSLGMRAEARRARRLAPPDLEQRLATYQKIRSIARHRP